MSTDTVMARLVGLSKCFVKGKEPIAVFDRLDFVIPRGDFVAVMGPSGSGKTTLLNLLGGIDSPDSGEVHVGGTRIDRLGEGRLARWRGANIGFIFQFYNLMPMLTARQNVELPLLLTKLRARERRRAAETALKVVNLTDRIKHYPREMSGGQQQRVAIGRALAPKPLLLLADEPTGNLDEDTADEVLALALDLVARTGCGFLMVTHSARLAATLDRQVTLHAGVVA
jgi:putative ABC transport system ATP-binding protein